MLRTICASLALAALVTLSGCRHTTAYRSTCAPVCPTPVVAASPVAVAVPAAPAPCCNTPGGVPAPPPSPPAFGH